MSEMDHLTRAAQAALTLTNAERLSRIRADRWIGYTRARLALQRLEELLTWPRKQRMPNLLVVGPTNNGKTMIVEKFKRDHTIVVAEGSEHELIPIVSIQVPSEPSVLRFYAMLLANIGAPLRPRAKVSELEHLALRLLRAVKTEMLIVDELHNVLAGTTPVRREFLNLLRFLGNELRIPIVAVGTREAYLAIRSDDQLENRFEPLPLLAWEEGEELISLLASFAAALPLKRPSEIASAEMSRFILSRTEGTIGEIAKLLVAAAIAAVETGEECINQRTLTLAHYESPTERRRTFERVLV